MSVLVFTYALNGLMMIAMPVGLAIFLARRWKMGWRIWWIGFLTFVLSQLGHIPFNAGAGIVLNRTGLVYWPLPAQQVFSAVFLGLSAGLFEEGARYLVLRFWAREARSWRAGIQFGAGHGGAEAIIFGLLAMVNYVAWLLLRNPATFDSFVAAGQIPAGQVETAHQQLAAIWSQPWHLSLLPAVERFFAIPIQIGLALLVMQIFLRRQWFWFWLAVLCHALVDASAVLLQPYLSPVLLEGVVAIFAGISLILVYRLRQPEPVRTSPPAAQPAALPTIQPVGESPENLADTKYQG